MAWSSEEIEWPHRDRSRQINLQDQVWHIQHWPPEGSSASAEAVVLLHGTGSSTHSWRDVAPLLAPHQQTLAVDLPGHARSGPASDAGGSVEGMAAGVHRVLDHLRIERVWLVGHSAGAAVAAQMALTQPDRVLGIVSLNGALLPLTGPAWPLFSPLARLLAANPLVSQLLTLPAGDLRLVGRLLEGTGSRLTGQGQRLYQRLLRDPAHVSGALAMMARWNLDSLARHLPTLRQPLHLWTSQGDLTVPPAHSDAVARLVPGAVRGCLGAWGHLAHEEAPGSAAQLILDSIRQLEPS